MEKISNSGEGKKGACVFLLLLSACLWGPVPKEASPRGGGATGGCHLDRLRLPDAKGGRVEAHLYYAMFEGRGSGGAAGGGGTSGRDTDVRGSMRLPTHGGLVRPITSS